jgi:hypothetical protein
VYVCNSRNPCPCHVAVAGEALNAYVRDAHGLAPDVTITVESVGRGQRVPVAARTRFSHAPSPQQSDAA